VVAISARTLCYVYFVAQHVQQQPLAESAFLPLAIGQFSVWPQTASVHFSHVAQHDGVVCAL
jgi:hypothetical protein